MKKYLLFTGLLATITLTPLSSASATSGFQAGRIIDDSVFTNQSSMSVNDIQNFLNSKVPACDTNGQQLSEFGGPDLNGDGKVQRWEYGKQNYNQTTFPCLRDYTQDGVSAAQLIHNASQTYAINPQVMIVLLQKEQGLITDTWPLNIQYRSATGYGCPDTAPCDSEYYGLKNQIKWAATMFRAILNNSPTWYTPYVLGNNYIQYNPNASCGGSNVNIQNRSTQALYNYTPYQPSQAALDAGWGTVNCGAYGNRNFYLYFTSWFGSTFGGEAPIKDSITVSESLNITPDGSNNDSQIYTATFKLKNTSSTKINIGWMLVSVRDSANFNLDFPIKYVTIEPNSTYTYSASRAFQWTDNMKAYINGNIGQNIGWSTSIPTSESNAIKTKNFRVGSDVVITSQGLKIEKLPNTNSFQASVTFKNRTNQDKNIGWFLISARTPFNENVDFPTQSITVPANGTYTYSQVRTLDLSDLGNFKFFPNLNDTSEGGLGWTSTYPINNDIWTKRSATYLNGPNIVQSEPLTTTENGSGKITSTIAFTNQGKVSESLGWVIISVRRTSDNTNYDYKPQALTLKPGETKRLTFSQQTLRGGEYKTSLIFNRADGWSTTYAPPASATLSRDNNTNVPYVVQQVGEISLSNSGEKTTASITLKNTAMQAVNLGWTIVQIRDTNGNNLDFPGISTTLQPNETRTFSTTRDLKKSTYNLSLTNYHPTYKWGPMFNTGTNSYPYEITN